MKKLSRMSVGKMSVGKKKVSQLVKRATGGMRMGSKRPIPMAKGFGGDLAAKPKGFGPADIGLVPSKKRKY